MEMDFIGLFQKSTYENKYIYNLVDYFFKDMYPHPISVAGREDVISSFNYDLWFNSKSCVMYMDAGTYFTSQKLCI